MLPSNTLKGTWAGGVFSSRKTVVSEFVKLISEHENVYETPVDGVGSDGSWVNWIIGGMLCGPSILYILFSTS